MKKWTSKLVAASLAVVMVASSITPTALAAPKSESKKAVANEEVVFSNNTKDLLKAAKVMASYSELVDSVKEEKTSPEKEAVKDVIFHSYNEEADLSDYDITSKQMDKLTKEVLEENSMEDAVDVTYETDANNKVTTVSVEMDSVVAMAAEEVAATGLTQDEKDALLKKYAEYQQSMIAIQNPETGEVMNIQNLFGIQTPFFTAKDDLCPVGSLLSIAGIPDELLAAGLEGIVAGGYMDFATISGTIDLFTYANMFTAMFKGEQIGEAIQTALGGIPKEADTQEEILLYINDWLAQNCTFDMPYIMKMASPEPDTTSAIAQDRQQIYDFMYQNIYDLAYENAYKEIYANVYKEVYNEVYKKAYNITLANTGDEDIAKATAEAKAKEQAEAYAPVEAETFAKGYVAQYMDVVTEDPNDAPSGSEQAMTMAASIINLWEGNHVGALTYGTAVCLGYSNAYTLLVQHAFPNVYKNDKGEWKTYEELNKGSNGSWEAMVDYVRISFDTEVTMFGVTQDDFRSDHYWNAVKVNGDWYYVDPCYTDVFVEVMARDRVETNGNMSHLYFMFSHEAANELYKGYYSKLDTAYADAANDRTYEKAWFAYARSPIFTADDYYYYMYDSTDMIEQQKESSNNNFNNDTQYKVVRYSAKEAMTGKNYETLIDFTAADGNGGTNAPAGPNGGYQETNTYVTILNPKTGEMEKDALLQEMYEKHKAYQEDYPSLQISVAYHNGLVYFNLANCIFTYDVETGVVERAYEYNEVYGERNMQKAFGGMAFTTTSKANADVSVYNPPIAGMTIKNGTMYVDVATALGFISGKDRDNMDDPSNYGYEFEETNYNQEYLYASYMDGDDSQYEEYIDTKNDNDEFMWSANIVDTVDLGCKHSFKDITVAETCTTAQFTESRCSACGKVASDGLQETTLSFKIVDEKGNTAAVKDAEGNAITVEDLVTETLERNFILNAFGYDAVKAHVDAAFGDVEYLAIELTETIEWSKKATAEIVVAGEDSDVLVGDELADLKDAKVNITFVETVAHEHGGDCYETVECTKEVHEHTDATGTCYGLTCTSTEEGHEHTAECQGLVCGKTEHTHSDECTKKLDCDKTTEEKNVGDVVTITRKAEDAYTFTADEIKAYVPSGYEVTGDVSSSNVNVNEETSKKVAVVKAADKASLQIIVKAGDFELGSALLSKGNSASDATEATFTADEIKEAADKLYNSDIYKVATVESNAVKLGEKEVLEITLTPAEYEATLTINVAGSEEPITVTSKVKGVKGEYYVFSVEDIVKAIGVKEGFAITSLVSDKVVEFSATGEIEVTVESTTEAVEGHGHAYVEHRETYYTRENEEDANSPFNKGTCYVCIYCKDAVEDKPLDQMYTLSNPDKMTDIWTWSVDLASASLYEIPTELDDVRLDCVWENPELGSKRTVAKVSGPVQSGSCDKGLTYTYTASANGKTTTNKNTVPAGKHVYSDASIKYTWDIAKAPDCKIDEHMHGEACYGYVCGKTEEADHVHEDACVGVTCKAEEHTHMAACYPATCKADYECVTCHEKGSGDCNVTTRDVDVTCDTDSAAVYTAVIELSGVPYSNQKQIATGDLAYGHNYDDEYKICKICGKEKPESVVSLPATITIAYTGKAVAGVADYAQVEGSTGKVTVGYYTDKACKTKTNKDDHGAAKAGAAPSNIGEYYVKVSVAEDANYLKAVSNVSKLTICPKPVSGVTAKNVASGIQISWKKSSEATGYAIYRSTPDGAYERVTTIKKNATVKWVDEDVKNSSTYTYDVRSYKKSASSSKNLYSEKAVEGTTIIRGKVAASNKTNGVLVKWSKVPGATGYKVYRKAVGDSKWTTLATVDRSTVSYTDKKATNGTNYYYTVKSTGNNVTRTNDVKLLYLADPTIKKLTSPSKGALQLTWTRNTKGNGYQIVYSTSKTFDTYKKVTISNKNTNTKKITGLSKNKTYYVKIRAYKKVDGKNYYSSYTDVSSVKTKK